MQKPWLEASASRPDTPAWCPGGRTTQKALRLRPRKTRSTAVFTAPAARRAAFSDPTEKDVSQLLLALNVSPRLSSGRCAAMLRCTCATQRAHETAERCHQRG